MQCARHVWETHVQTVGNHTAVVSCVHITDIATAKSVFFSHYPTDRQYRSV